jgi:hypothetical protein
MALKWRHAGQACITANRVYVQKGVYDKFAAILKERTSKLVVGHGAEKGTTMGPVTTPRSLDKALNQVEDAKKHGGQVILGGGKVNGKGGYFFEPTIILGATKEMLITEEETFAPVLAMYSFDTEEEAVEAANNTSMGLASYYFTKNIDRTWRLLENLEAGMIGMNTGELFLKWGVKYDLTRNRKLISCRISFRRYQRIGIRKGIWKGCRCGRIPDHQDWYLDSGWSLLRRMAREKHSSCCFLVMSIQINIFLLGANGSFRLCDSYFLTVPIVILARMCPG